MPRKQVLVDMLTSKEIKSLQGLYCPRNFSCPIKACSGEFGLPSQQS